MSDRYDKPTSLDAALAAQIQVARMRGAYSIETLSALARVEPETIAGLVNGAPVADVSARVRVMDVLGLRPGNHRSPTGPTDRTLPISD